MKCPYCGCEESKVVDSRPTDEGERIRRRRECFNCSKRFTTYEIVETTPVMVVKRDQIDHIVDEVEIKIQNTLDREISSRTIGEYTMDVLKNVDEVAYVRFASVYRQFKDIHSFMEELKRLIEEK